MKTKLLKKIRKQWIIIKVTDIGIRPTDSDRERLEEFGYPFYEVWCKGDNFGYRSRTYKTEQECKDYLLLWVKEDYEWKMKPKAGKTKKEEKVWYVHKT